MGRLEQFLAELKRRRVIRALLGWGILAFAVLQVIDPLLRALDAKDWVLKVVVAALAAGFPVTAVLSWLYDLTSRGVVRTRPADTALAETLHRAVPRRAGADPDSDSPAGRPRASAPATPSPPDASRPGPLSALIQELAQAPGDTLLSAWGREIREGDRVGRFRILREIGRGGFGAVYEAEDTELGRHVALKALRPRRTGKELSADAIKREAEAVARLDHPCIVTLFDVGTSDGDPYLVMELLHGESLADRLVRGPLGTDEALHVARQVARGLAHAHRRGILHRDLKPANVFVCDDGRVKLLDFGLAHLLGAKGASGSGTPGYMAPEQARGEEIDARADVWAAALMLRESLTGSREPGDGAELPRALAKVVEPALSRSPDDRPRDGTAWLELVGGARKVVERPRKVARVAALGLAAIALAAGAAFVAWRHGRGSAPVAEAGAPSVAVLAFADLSPGHDQEYLADGVAEEVLNGLAQVEGLRVVGRSTAFSYKGKGKKVEEVGRELGVGAVLEGSVRKSGDKVRINAQLVRARDASTLWSQSFERNLADVFAVQDEIGRAVVEALAVRLVPGRPISRAGGTTNVDAIQLYLRGRDQLRHGGQEIPKAWETFERAVKLDPRFALAWVGVADAIVTIEAVAADVQGDAGVRRRRAREAADAAVGLAPGLADAFRARADVHQWLEADWRAQREDLERARALAPGDPAVALSNGWYLLAVGRTDEAVAAFERVTRDDPLLERGWVNGWIGLASAAYSRGDHARAREAARRGMEVFPGYRVFFLSVIALDRVAAGEARDALAMTAEFRAHPPFGPVWALIAEALALPDLGRKDEGVRAREELVREFAADGPYQIAEVFAWQGDADGAFGWLEKARTLPDTAMFWLKTDPLLGKVRGDPRWAALLARAGLPPDGEVAGTQPGAASVQAVAAAGPAAAAPQASIAVLPFADMSPKHDQEYLADGVAEEILNALMQVEGVKVVGRTSSFSLKGKADDLRSIGQKLGVANLLEGSVRTDRGRVRITAKLVRAADGAQLWSESYERKLVGIFQIQDEIARAVTRALEVKLVAGGAPAAEAGQTRNPDAYRANLLGQHLLRQFESPSARRAADAFREAIRIDPAYAAAWAGLSMALWRGAENPLTEEQGLSDKRAALDAANRAIALAPAMAAGYAARASLTIVRDWDWKGAFADARRAVELSPRDPRIRTIAGVLMIQAARWEDAVRELELATALDPLDAEAWGWLGVARQDGFPAEPAKVTQAFDRAREINPRNHFASYQADGPTNTPEGRRAWAEARVKRGADPDDCTALTLLALAHAVLEHREAARRAIEHVAANCPNSALQVAQTYCRIGETKLAADWLERAIANMDTGLTSHGAFQCFLQAGRPSPYEKSLQRVRPPPD